MLELLFFLFLGVLFGIIMGLVPGVHPNMIVLLIPLLGSIGMDFASLIVFVVAMGATNSVVDFIPSMLLGAPDAGSELSTMPGHRMLMSGHGYSAIKLAVTGAVWSSILIVAILPLLVFSVPFLYDVVNPFIYLLLLFIVFVMVLTEEGKKKIVAAAVLLLSGWLGMIISSLPVDTTLVLFPVFSGFFGMSALLLQLRQKSAVPKQVSSEVGVSRKTINRSVLCGTLGGLASGFLPGAGSSEIATLATVDKNDKSFLITLGALTTANTILSIMALWLIGRSRSGLAVVIGQFGPVGGGEFLLIVSTFIASIGIAAPATLILARIFVRHMQKIDYSSMGKIVMVFIVFMTFVFTGLTGLAILATCTVLGMFAVLSGIKRGNMMGVLLIPTIIFYATM